MRPDRVSRVFLTKFVVVFHDFAHQVLDQMLADRAVLARRQFWNRLRNSDNHFIRLTGIHLSETLGATGYSDKKSSISSTIMQ